AGFPSKQDAAAVTVGCGQQQTPVNWIEVIPLQGYRIAFGLANHLFSLMTSMISMLAWRVRLRSWTAHNQLLRHGWRNQSRHFADHGQHKPLVAVRKRGAVLLDLRQEANFVLRELAQRFLRFTVAGRFRTGGKNPLGKCPWLPRFW